MRQSCKSSMRFLWWAGTGIFGTEGTHIEAVFLRAATETANAGWLQVTVKLMSYVKKINTVCQISSPRTPTSQVNDLPMHSVACQLLTFEMPGMNVKSMSKYTSHGMAHNGAGLMLIIKATFPTPTMKSKERRPLRLQNQSAQQLF